MEVDHRLGLLVRAIVLSNCLCANGKALDLVLVSTRIVRRHVIKLGSQR